MARRATVRKPTRTAIAACFIMALGLLAYILFEFFHVGVPDKYTSGEFEWDNTQHVLVLAGTTSSTHLTITAEDYFIVVSGERQFKSEWVGPAENNFVLQLPVPEAGEYWMLVYNGRNAPKVTIDSGPVEADVVMKPEEALFNRVLYGCTVCVLVVFIGISGWFWLH